MDFRLIREVLAGLPVDILALAIFIVLWYIWKRQKEIIKILKENQECEREIMSSHLIFLHGEIKNYIKSGLTAPEYLYDCGYKLYDKYKKFGGNGKMDMLKKQVDEYKMIQIRKEAEGSVDINSLIKDAKNENVIQ